MAGAEQYLNSPSTRSDDLLRVARAISASATCARSHVDNCRKLSEHASLVAKTLGVMKGTFLMELDVIKEVAIDELAEALMRGAELVECCVVKSVLYMVATGWNVVYKFREVHEEMDRFLKPKALDLFVEEFRMQDLKEAIKATRNDVRRYELDDEDMEFQRAILKPDRTRNDADIIERSLSRYYPNMEIAEALGEERQKLQVELERFTAGNDPKMCRLVEHLIEVTGNVMNDFPTRKAYKLIANLPAYVISGYITNAGAIADALKVEDQGLNHWQTDLFDCCKEPCLSLKTCIYPCGLFSRIAYEATGGRTAKEAAISHLLAYSLFCGCCCYTCWIRKKLREMFNIEVAVISYQEATPFIGGVCNSRGGFTGQCVRRLLDTSDVLLLCTGSRMARTRTKGIRRMPGAKNDPSTFSVHESLAWPSKAVAYISDAFIETKA